MEGTDSTLKDRSSTYWSHPPLEGFLHKKGAKGINPKYKRRWFVLKDSQLHYYKTSDASSTSHRGYIDLTGDYSIEDAHNESSHNFRIRTTDRLWYLSAESEEEYRFWLQGLSSFKRRQQKFPLGRENFFNQRFDSFSSSIQEDEDAGELKELLLDAERELEAKQNNIEDLYADLQNSLQVIKLRGEQIDLLNQRISEKDEEIKRLKNDDASQPCDSNIIIDESDTQVEEEKKEEIEDSIKKIESDPEEEAMIDLSKDMSFLSLLLKEMECFVVYLEDNEPPGSAKIAIDKWIANIKDQQKRITSKQV